MSPTVRQAICPRCLKPAPPGTSRCPYCRERLISPRRMYMIVGGVGIVVLLIVIALAIFLKPLPDELDDPDPDQQQQQHQPLTPSPPPKKPPLN
jgi:hypothetical protein